MDSVDLGPIRHALELAQEHGFREVELEIGDVSFEARLEPRKKVSVPSHDEMGAEPEPEEPLAPEPVAVAATCVGYFKVGPAPLEPGRRVRKGDRLGTITALGIPNDVESAVDGDILDVLVKDGEAVEFGQTLLSVLVTP